MDMGMSYRLVAITAKVDHQPKPFFLAANFILLG
jgi:hypothetical protein